MRAAPSKIFKNTEVFRANRLDKTILDDVDDRIVEIFQYLVEFPKQEGRMARYGTDPFNKLFLSSHKILSTQVNKKSNLFNNKL